MQCGRGVRCAAKVRHKVEVDSRGTADDTEPQCVVERSIEEGGKVAGLLSTAASCQKCHSCGGTVAMKGQVCRPTGSDNGHVALDI